MASQVFIQALKQLRTITTADHKDIQYLKWKHQANIKRYTITGMSIIILSACASSTPTFAPDGREAFSLNCSGTLRDWGMCHEKAGEICGSKGYDVLVQNGEQGATIQGSSNASVGGGGNRNTWGLGGSSSSNIFGSSLHFRTMTIACKD